MSYFLLGEGKIPTNNQREETWDIDGFPRHLCDGKFGLNYKRPKKINPQPYFSQRLTNVDKRFSKDADWVFIAQQYVERFALERQISISYQKG